jgi:hypothetical protein
MESCSSDALISLFCGAGDAHPVPAQLPLHTASAVDRYAYSQSLRNYSHLFPDAAGTATELFHSSGITKKRPRPSKRNPTSWGPLEDQRLLQSVSHNGTRNWANVASTMQVLSGGECDRTGKQCRERWHNHLDPTLSHEPFSLEEDNKLVRLQSIFFNRWTEISKRMPGRSDNAVKNRWNSCLCKYAVSENGTLATSVRSADSASEAEFAASPWPPVQVKGCVEAVKQQSVSAEFPCAVRSMLQSLPEATFQTESCGSIRAVAADMCLADQCSHAADYGFRSASGRVRRTRCMVHHEAGMYVLASAIVLQFCVNFFLQGL